MQYLKQVFGALLSAGLGLIFIYSGYTKLLPVIETFEFSFVELGIANWYTAPFFARTLIALEFFVGLLHVSGFHLKKITLPLTVALLVFFIFYLIGQILVSGNEGNCGCFGEHLRMTPLQAIIKNIVMLAVCALIFFTWQGWKSRWQWLFVVATVIVSLALPFSVNPVDYTYTSNNLDEKVNYPLELDLLYAPRDSSKVEIPTVELRKGKQVLAFLSLSCPHCHIAAKKFRLIKKNNPAIPIYFVLNGDKEKYPAFVAETKADNIPSSFCLGKTFVQLSSARLPRIMYLDNGIVIKKVDYYELNQYEIETWLKTGQIP